MTESIIQGHNGIIFKGIKILKTFPKDKKQSKKLFSKQIKCMFCLIKYGVEYIVLREKTLKIPNNY